VPAAPAEQVEERGHQLALSLRRDTWSDGNDPSHQLVSRHSREIVRIVAQVTAKVVEDSQSYPACSNFDENFPVPQIGLRHVLEQKVATPSVNAGCFHLAEMYYAQWHARRRGS
jgi:hypothetical protein